jgi:site-specific DNA recombinase
MQREVCESEANKVGATVVDEFVDAGVSGNTIDRHGLRRLLKFITENPITYIIVCDRARLSRNYRDDLVIRQTIGQARATVVSVDEGIDQAALGPLLHNVVSAFAEFTSIDRRYV